MWSFTVVQTVAAIGAIHHAHTAVMMPQMLQAPGLSIIAIVMWVVMFVPSLRNTRKGRMALFWTQLFSRVIYTRSVYFFTLFTGSETWNIAAAGCDGEGELLFPGENCEVAATQYLFFDNLLHIWYEIYILTIFYKWAKMANEDPESKVQVAEEKPGNSAIN